MQIQKALVEIMRDRTVIAVAHRLSTVVAFDRIIVIENGRIVEDGSPQELGASGGVFNRMWQQQAHGFNSNGLTSGSDGLDEKVDGHESVE